MSVVVLTGGPGAGKSTVMLGVSARRVRCATIDVDDVRQMLRQPHVPPWAGPEGQRQHLLGVRNACALARNFCADGADVVIADVLTDDTARIYREELNGLDLTIVRLIVDRGEAWRRAAQRHYSITDEEFGLLHDQQELFAEFDTELDTEELDLDSLVDRVVGLMNAAASPSEDPPTYRFYGELARWWPLVSPVKDYEEEATFVGAILARASGPVRTVLELGSGGGHVAFYLKRQYEMTLVDLSAEMLDVSRAINPECEHHEGDMRRIRLGREFDAVLIYDAVDYMTTETDLSFAFANAYTHCRPGGVALFVPDHIVENFEETTDHDGHDHPDGHGVRFLVWTRDPDPIDTEIETDYVFLLREADGSSRVIRETHRTGLFRRADWLRRLSAAGFEAEAIEEETSEDRPARELFLGHRRE